MVEATRKHVPNNVQNSPRYTFDLSFNGSFKAAFRSSGRIIDDRRQNLKPEMVEALNAYKDWCQYEEHAQETFLNIDLVDNFDVNFYNITIQE